MRGTIHDQILGATGGGVLLHHQGVEGAHESGGLSTAVRVSLARQDDRDGWPRYRALLAMEEIADVAVGDLVRAEGEEYRVQRVETSGGLHSCVVHPRLPSLATLYEKSFAKTASGAESAGTVAALATNLRCLVRLYDATVETSARRTRANTTFRLYLEEPPEVRHGYLFVVDGVIYRPEEWERPVEPTSFFVAYCDRYGEVA